MAVPKLPAFDAKAANNAWRTLHRPDGSEFQVFGSESFVEFIRGLRAVRDSVASLDVQLNGKDGMKLHLDRVDARESQHHAAQEQRIAAIEAQLADSPFPG